MRFEDMPSLPLDTVGRDKLAELVRAAVTQCELLAQGAAAAAQCTALKDFFAGIVGTLAALATVKGAP